MFAGKDNIDAVTSDEKKVLDAYRSASPEGKAAIASVAWLVSIGGKHKSGETLTMLDLALSGMGGPADDRKVTPAKVRAELARSVKAVRTAKDRNPFRNAPAKK